MGECLSLSDVEVRWSGRTILAVEDIQIRQGEFVGIIGTNGAGKTTLLKVCCGLIRPTRGTVKLDGRDLAELSAWRKANLRKHIGYIPQAAEYNAELPFTLRELVAMGRTSVKALLSRLNKKDYEIVDNWIERLGLSERRSQTFSRTLRYLCSMSLARILISTGNIRLRKLSSGCIVRPK